MINKKYSFVILVFAFMMFFQSIYVSFAKVPESPSDLRAISGNQTVYLSWGKSLSERADLWGYKIYMSSDSGKIFDTIMTLPGDPPPLFYTVTGLENGQEYIFGISSYSQNLEESPMVKSDTVIPADTSMTDSIAPEDVSNLKVLPLDSKVKITFEHSLDTQSDLVGYHLYISKDGGKTFQNPIKIGYIDSYEVKDLINDQAYVFKISAFDEVPNENLGVKSAEVTPEKGLKEDTEVIGVELGQDSDATATFLDVSKDNLFQKYIEYLSAKGIMKGQDKKFFPDRTLTRGEAVKIILVATGQDKLKSLTKSTFKDVLISNPLAIFIEEAYNLNIVRGYGDQSFKPNQPVMRKEFSKMFMEAIQGTLKNPTLKANFKDVPLDHVFAKWIYSAYKKGYLGGYEDLTFRPDNQITRAEASKIVAKYLQGQTDTVIDGTNLEISYLGLINASRIDKGLSTLTLDNELTNIARLHAEDIAKNIKKTTSIGSDGKNVLDRLRDEGIPFLEASENVAKVSTLNRTKFEAIEALHSQIMALPDNEENQKANVLSTFKNFSVIGVGIYEDDENNLLYVVSDFISS